MHSRLLTSNTKMKHPQATKLVEKLLESPDSGVEVTLDFDDPEEREMTVWVNDPNPDTAREKVVRGNFSSLAEFGLSLDDAVEVGSDPVEGGTAFYFDFPPA